jgi:nucleotide-binding universal stress UspA family protein
MIIVAGVDDSDHARRVLMRAIEEAKALDADLHVVHVVQSPIYFRLPMDVAAPLDVAAIEAAERKAVWGSLDSILGDAEVPVNTVDLAGYPPDILSDYATENQAALLVIGTRGRGEFASFVLGSTSHRALHLAKCDVLVVKPLEAGTPH